MKTLFLSIPTWQNNYYKYSCTIIICCMYKRNSAHGICRANKIIRVIMEWNASITIRVYFNCMVREKSGLKKKQKTDFSVLIVIILRSKRDRTIRPTSFRRTAHVLEKTSTKTATTKTRHQPAKLYDGRN